MAAIELASTPLFSDANLVAYYKLEDVNDSKGSYTLTNNNTVAFNAAKFNNGADFGASNTNKSLSINSDLSIQGGNISVSFWVKNYSNPSTGAFTYFMTNNDTNDVEYSIFYQYNGGTYRLNFDRYKNPDSAGTDVFYNVDLGTSLFNHIVATYDGTTMRLYLNGIEVGNTPASGTGSGTTTTKTSIGARNDGLANYFSKSIIDDVAIFNRALTATEINKLYNGTWNTSSFFAFF